MNRAELITIDEAAREMGLSGEAVAELIRHGLQTRTIDGTVFVMRHEIEAIILRRGDTGLSIGNLGFR